MIASSVVAVGANCFEKSQPWIRKEPPPLAEETQPSSAQHPARPRGGVVTIDTVLQHLRAGTATFIDARESHEYEEGHLRGAMNLPSSAIFQNIQTILNMISVNTKVIVYCGGGTCEASHNVSDTLRGEFGFTDVSIYTKGWEEIEASGRSKEFIVKGANP